MKHVLFDDLSEEEKKIVKRLSNLRDIEFECTDEETAELHDLEEKFYNFVMDKAEEKNPDIDWNVADQSVFDIVADDRDKMIRCCE